MTEVGQPEVRQRPSIEAIARVCHEANRAWCEATGDTSQKPWDEAEDWQRESAIEGVEQALAGATPQQLHDAWCRSKVADGWRWGEVKDPEARTHPCLVDYAELPAEQQLKDHLFAAVVGALASAGDLDGFRRVTDRKL